MPKLEKEAMKDIRIALANLETAGAVLWWERLNSGKVRTEYGGYVQLCRNGTPDFIVALKTSMGLLILFIEAKSDTGKLSIQQNDFKEKTKFWAIYLLVRDVKQVKEKIEELTSFYKNKLKMIDF